MHSLKGYYHIKKSTLTSIIQTFYNPPEVPACLGRGFCAISHLKTRWSLGLYSPSPPQAVCQRDGPPQPGRSSATFDSFPAGQAVCPDSFL